jgi:hypothetical protein
MGWRAMRDHDHAYGLIGIGFGAVMSVVSTWFVEYPILQPVLLYGGMLLCAVGVLLLVPRRRFVDLWGRITQYEFYWPLRRKRGWPHSADLASRIYHARSFVDFSNLENDNSFTVTVISFNSCPFGLEVDSVSGFTHGEWLVGSKAVDIAWVGAPTKAAPLAELSVTFEQRVPASATEGLRAAFASGKNMSIMLDAVRIVVRAPETGERAQLSLWEGFICGISATPAFLSKTVTATARISINHNSLQARP